MSSSRFGFLLTGVLAASNVMAGPIGYWSFNENGGTTISDGSGYGHLGQLVNLRQNTWIVGASGPAIYFDGTVGPDCTRVVIDDTALLRLTNRLSFAAWIRCDDIGRDAPIFAKEGPGGQLSYWFGVFGPSGAGNWGSLFDQDGWQGWDFVGRQQGYVPQGRWTHVAFTWDGSQALYYVNGSPTNSTTWNGLIHQSPARLFIGSNSEYTFESNHTAFRGAVDEIYIYDTVITPDEVARLASSVNGQVILDDLAISPAGQRVDFELIQGTTVLEAKPSLLDESGSFVFHSALLGPTTIKVKASHWLAKTIGVFDLTSTDIKGVNAELINGDCDGDNEITLADYSQLSTAFSSVSGDPNWNANADLNVDDEVNLADYSILSRNFGQTGDE